MMKKTTQTGLILLLLVCSSVYAGNIKLIKAEGYITDKLITRHDAITKERTLADHFRFLVVQLEYKVQLDNDNDRYSLSDSDMKLKCYPSGEVVTCIARLIEDGGGAGDSIYYNHYKGDNDKTVVRWPIFPVKKSDKKFTLDFKGCKKMKVRISPELKQSISKQSAAKNIKSCSITKVEPVKEFIYRCGYNMPFDKKYHTKLTKWQTKNGQLTAITMKVLPQGGTNHFRFGESVISVKDNKTGSIYPFLISSGGVVNPSLSPSQGTWQEKEITFAVNLPKNCDDFSVLYFGEPIASWNKK